MIIIDKMLQKREAKGDYIRVGIVGCGVMGTGIMNQINRYTPGIKVVAAYNRNLTKAISACNLAGIKQFEIVESPEHCESVINKGVTAITSDIELICTAPNIDIVVEVTGTVEFATELFLMCFENGKNVLSFNEEIEATIGPYLKVLSKKAGVKYGVADGDQPAVTINLFRFVESMGFKPLLCGNIKGLHDRYRNPQTQSKFAARWEMTPEMVTSFADGTKISFEQTCIANAIGFKVAKRGMIGLTVEGFPHVDELKGHYDYNMLVELDGIVDYVVGALPGPGVYIYATAPDDKFVKKYLNYMKLGEGPLYTFYTPYHLLFFEIGNSICRMIDYDDTILEAKGTPCVEVITCAKIELNAGDTIDSIGGFKSYGICENYKIARSEGLLPMGLAEGCTLLHKKKRDEPLKFSDVEVPQGRKSFHLYQKQCQYFS